MDISQSELRLLMLALHQLAMADDKGQSDSTYLSIQQLSDDEIEDMTVTLRVKLSRRIRDVGEDYIL